MGAGALGEEAKGPRPTPKPVLRGTVGEEGGFLGHLAPRPFLLTLLSLRPSLRWVQVGSGEAGKASTGVLVS